MRIWENFFNTISTLQFHVVYALLRETFLKFMLPEVSRDVGDHISKLPEGRPLIGGVGVAVRMIRLVFYQAPAARLRAACKTIPEWKTLHDFLFARALQDEFLPFGWADSMEWNHSHFATDAMTLWLYKARCNNTPQTKWRQRILLGQLRDTYEDKCISVAWPHYIITHHLQSFLVKSLSCSNACHPSSLISTRLAKHLPSSFGPAIRTIDWDDWTRSIRPYSDHVKWCVTKLLLGGLQTSDRRQKAVTRDCPWCASFQGDRWEHLALCELFWFEVSWSFWKRAPSDTFECLGFRARSRARFLVPTVAYVLYHKFTARGTETRESASVLRDCLRTLSARDWKRAGVQSMKPVTAVVSDDSSSSSSDSSTGAGSSSSGSSSSGSPPPGPGRRGWGRGGRPSRGRAGPGRGRPPPPPPPVHPDTTRPSMHTRFRFDLGSGARATSATIQPGSQQKTSTFPHEASQPATGP